MVVNICVSVPKARDVSHGGVLGRKNLRRMNCSCKCSEVETNRMRDGQRKIIKLRSNSPTWTLFRPKYLQLIECIKLECRMRMTKGCQQRYA